MQEAMAPKSSASRKLAKRTGFHEATHGKTSYSAFKVIPPKYITKCLVQTDAGLNFQDQTLLVISESTIDLPCFVY